MQKPNDFLTQLFEPARAKILRLFVLHDTEEMSVAEVAKRTSVASVNAQKEITALQKIGVLKERKGEGRTARERVTKYSFDEKSKYANTLSTFIHEISPERFGDVERALKGIGRLSAIVLSGIFIGDVQRPADLIIVGDFVNDKRLERAVKSFEPKYGREIRYAVFSTPEFRYRLTIHDKLIRDTLDYPHRLLLNKHNLI
ncbi:MAG: hypothetical protein WA021_04740 [Minisyncoccia bacterium]